MARLSIYLPDELKARMDEVGDSVNWSEVVRPAIQTIVATHEQRRSRDMTAAIERLRASKQEFEKGEIENGKADGRTWAELRADYKDLLQVSKIDVTAQTWPALRHAVDPDGNLDNDEILVYLFGIREDGTELSDEYIDAFIDGAKDFFDEVADKI